MSSVPRYISVILNGLTGVYILVYSVLANKTVRGAASKQMNSYINSTMLSSDKVSLMGLMSDDLIQIIRATKSRPLNYTIMNLDWQKDSFVSLIFVPFCPYS